MGEVLTVNGGSACVFVLTTPADLSRVHSDPPLQVAPRATSIVVGSLLYRTSGFLSLVSLSLFWSFLCLFVVPFLIIFPYSIRLLHGHARVAGVLF